MSAFYRGYQILELPPNGQGIVVLEALRILERTDLASLGHNATEAVHLQVEATKLAMEDSKYYVTDPGHLRIDAKDLLADGYIAKQRALISGDHAIQAPAPGSLSDSDTVHICTADQDGNVASFINSIFKPWGTGITVGGTGILLQNRGSGFSLEPNHVNVIAPHKQTRHTLMPAMVIYNGKPLMAYGFVGGDMQPQGQVQFICNMVDFGMNVQDALDAPRWRYSGEGARIALESGIGSGTRNGLMALGHEDIGDDGFFGGGQSVLIHPEYGCLQGGSDSRRDGCAIGY
jgi:gamma-glutamyltranspeptidase/glutathione hydrolase